MVPAVVQGLINSVEFTKEHLQGAVQTVVHSASFLEKNKEAVQAAFDSPQFQEKVSGAVRAVMLSSAQSSWMQSQPEWRSHSSR